MKPALIEAILSQSSRIRLIDAEHAKELVSGKTEKPTGVDPGAFFIARSTQYLLASIPLHLFAPNEDSERYDGTVDTQRAQHYARRLQHVMAVDGHDAAVDTVPPIIAGARKADLLGIIDGGHRITAARLAGTKEIMTLMRVPEGMYEFIRALCELREGFNELRQQGEAVETIADPGRSPFISDGPSLAQCAEPRKHRRMAV